MNTRIRALLWIVTFEFIIFNQGCFVFHPAQVCNPIVIASCED